MKHTGILLMALMLLTSVAHSAPEPGKLSMAGGQIASIDNDANSLTVTVADPAGETQELTLVVADDSKIVKNGAKIALSDLKEGDKVTVTYQAENGKNVVVNIGVETKT
jgi:Cu/Ag efflux protein CusF